MAFHDESQFVRWLVQQGTGLKRGLIRGIGDDAALVRSSPEQDWMLTTDLSIEGVHFLEAIHPPGAVGHRALARSLSDVAAMGGTPRFSLVSLALTRKSSGRWLKAFYRGMSQLARRFGVTTIGGDTAVVPDRITVDVVVVGEVAKGQAVFRSGAHPGDQIFVSGCLGLSGLGLSLLKSGRRAREAWAAAARRAHLYPEPQCALGRFLAARRLASALIDISDGLSNDLGRICESSGVGATIWERRLPIPPAGHQRESPELDRLRLALNGGEDYQLLFTVPPDKASSIPSKFHGIPLHLIGEIQRSKRIFLIHADSTRSLLRPGGYDHFRKRGS